jgi:uncharacterized protein with gpF-like domain
VSWDVSFDPVDFAEAIKFFRARVPMTDGEYAALEREATAQAFTVAGVAQLDVVAQVYDAVLEALEKGTTLADFQEAVGDSLERAWGDTVADPGWRTETIFRTNLQSHYAAGRYEQSTDPDVLTARPFWRFDAVMDGATTQVCEDSNGTILHAGNQWWAGHYPPCHFNCRSVTTTLSPDDAAEAGLDDAGPHVGADPGFGGLPGKAPAWTPDPSDYPPELWNKWREKKDARPHPV